MHFLNNWNTKKKKKKKKLGENISAGNLCWVCDKTTEITEHFRRSFAGNNQDAIDAGKLEKEKIRRNCPKVSWEHLICWFGENINYTSQHVLQFDFSLSDTRNRKWKRFHFCYPISKEFHIFSGFFFYLFWNISLKLKITRQIKVQKEIRRCFWFLNISYKDLLHNALFRLTLFFVFEDGHMSKSIVKQINLPSWTGSNLI